MFLTTQMIATNIAPLDIVLFPTPVGPIPTPFVNISVSSVSVPTVYNIFIWAMPCHNNLTVTEASLVAGPGPGIVSSAVFGATRTIVSSFTMFYGGMPVNKMFGTTGQNGMPIFAIPFNSVGVQLSPSQVSVMCLS